MNQIIDATLQVMCKEDKIMDQQSNVQFLNDLKLVGITNILLNKRLFDILSDKIPREMKIYIELEPFEETFYSPQVYAFIGKHSNQKVIEKVQLNDIREIRGLNQIRNESGVLLSGLDDFICYDFQNKIQYLKEQLKDTPVIIRAENSAFCATAMAVECLMAKCGYVVTSFMGIGNLAATEQVVMAARYSGQFRMKQNFEYFSDMKRLLENQSNLMIATNTPIIGERIFEVESGIHVDGILKSASNYECVSPKLLGQKRTIILGKHSGRSSVEYKSAELQLSDLTKVQKDIVLKKIREKSIQKGTSISDEEFCQIVKEVCI